MMLEDCTRQKAEFTKISGYRWSIRAPLKIKQLVIIYR